MLLDKVKNQAVRVWYARAAIEHGWSRNVLVCHIESKLYELHGKATTNFERALPPPQSDLARELLKDPYNFEFLTLQQDAEERKLEKGLVAHSYRSSCSILAQASPLSAASTNLRPSADSRERDPRARRSIME